MDRNPWEFQDCCGVPLSLSARRAWIEIPFDSATPEGQRVALRKESVDRNGKACGPARNCAASLSARRAWIEIMPRYLNMALAQSVALRKESVDRNR